MKTSHKTRLAVYVPLFLLIVAIIFFMTSGGEGSENEIAHNIQRLIFGLLGLLSLLTLPIGVIYSIHKHTGDE